MGKTYAAAADPSLGGFPPLLEEQAAPIVSLGNSIKGNLLNLDLKQLSLSKRNFCQFLFQRILNLN